ncbi:glycosyltransferase, partial [bacterium]|nr:glycosyltransferase [bacterium]
MMTGAHTISSDLPKTSVIVLTRNRVQSLLRTLNSLKNLNYPNYEVIVVDNDSTDNTKEMALQHDVIYVHAPARCGIGNCRQLGAMRSTGEIIAFCDDDCIPSSDWLNHLVRRLTNEPDLGLIGGQVINIGFPGKNGSGKKFKGRSRLGKNGKIVFVEDPREAEFFGNMNLALRREVFEEIGGYDPFFHVMEEIDLALRIRKRGYRIDFEPEAVLQHYYTGTQEKKRHLFFCAGTIRLYLC